MLNAIFAATIAIWPGNVEKPPAEYIDKPYVAKIEEYETSEEVDARCRWINGAIPRGKTYLACYSPLYQTIVVPIQDDRVAKALLIHEAAHASGWRHQHKDW